MTEVRDWHKDMERVELSRELHEKYGAIVEGVDPKESLDEVLSYWLQQYAAEKECANGLEQTLIQTTASLVNAESREKKMRDEIDGTIPLLEAAGLLVRASRLRELLASLYPLEKEEEAK